MAGFLTYCIGCGSQKKKKGGEIPVNQVPMVLFQKVNGSCVIIIKMLRPEKDLK